MARDARGAGGACDGPGGRAVVFVDRGLGSDAAGGDILACQGAAAPARHGKRHRRGSHSPIGYIGAVLVGATNLIMAADFSIRFDIPDTPCLAPRA